MVKRGDWFTDEDRVETTNGNSEDHKKGRRSSPVVWVSFGLTHNPRVEDWPVMFVLYTPELKYRIANEKLGRLKRTRSIFALLISLRLIPPWMFHQPRTRAVYWYLAVIKSRLLNK